jgi:hypothetical protein
MSAAQHARASVARLTLVPAPSLTTAVPAGSGPEPSWAARRPAVLRICAGEPLILEDDEVDFVDLANNADQINELLLDDTADPDTYSPTEVAVEYFCYWYGLERHAKGDRVKGVESHYRRYLVPFLVEMEAARPAARRGVAQLRIRDLETLPRVLRGDLPLPAATVAGDLLGRRGIACVYLAPADAARVSTGGLTALEEAVASGAVPVRRDVRTGSDIIAAADLRQAGLLAEPQTPHGLSKKSAQNVLQDLTLSMARARTHGANIRGAFELEASEPLVAKRGRAERPKREYVSIALTAATAAGLPVTGQVVLWFARLTGVRISEAYGPRVDDYFRDSAGRPWLSLGKQGGTASYGRNERGKLQPQHQKPDPKTGAGLRTIPIPEHFATMLDMLIAVYHTDVETGQVDRRARLIPGVRRENQSGQSTFRTWLEEALACSGQTFTPHVLRGALITDLKGAGIDERRAHYYAGHKQPNATIQDIHYDFGPSSADLHAIADLLDAKIAEELGCTDLKQPTPLRESWGANTRRHRQSAAIEQRLQACGWRSTEPADATLGRELDAEAVGKMIDRSAAHTRRLMRTGDIVAHLRPWREREVWWAYEADVQRYLTDNAGVTVTELSAELGWSYHQVWHLLRELGLVSDDHLHRRSLRLTSEAADRLREEARRRSDVVAHAVSVREAAHLLQMEVVTVETLIRQQRLELTDGPGNTRHRYVTRTSIDRYNRSFPPVPNAGQGSVDVEEERLTFTEARLLLGVSRPHLSEMTTTRQVRTLPKPGSRHLYISAASAIAWAERTRRPAAATAVREALARRAGPGGAVVES